MTNISQKILFFGTEDFSALSLQALLDADFDVAAVITKPDSRKGRGQKVIAPKVKIIAEAHGIPVLQPTKLSEVTDHIRSLQPVTGVLVSFGKIIPQSMIDLFTPGIINVHPSLLPQYRGPSPIESAIMNGDRETGVTIMQLSAAMDAGPVYTQVRHTLNGDETQPDLYNTLGHIGAQLLVTTLPQILNNSLLPTPQDDSNSTYCKLLEKSDTTLDPGSHTASELERQVRAHLDFPRSKIVFRDHTLIVTQASAASEQKTALDLQCRDGSYLIIEQIIATSGKKMNAEAFIRGYTA